MKTQQTWDSNHDFNIRLPPNVASSVYMDPDTSTSSDSEGSCSDSGTAALETHVTVCDINQSMLEVGKSRAMEAGICSGIAFSLTHVFRVFKC